MNVCVCIVLFGCCKTTTCTRHIIYAYIGTVYLYICTHGRRAFYEFNRKRSDVNVYTSCRQDRFNDMPLPHIIINIYTVMRDSRRKRWLINQRAAR